MKNQKRYFVSIAGHRFYRKLFDKKSAQRIVHRANQMRMFGSEESWFAKYY